MQQAMAQGQQQFSAALRFAASPDCSQLHSVQRGTSALATLLRRGILRGKLSQGTERRQLLCATFCTSNQHSIYIRRPSLFPSELQPRMRADRDFAQRRPSAMFTAGVDGGGAVRADGKLQLVRVLPKSGTLQASRRHRSDGRGSSPAEKTLGSFCQKVENRVRVRCISTYSCAIAPFAPCARQARTWSHR
jgi:hypothetical protein